MKKSIVVMIVLALTIVLVSTAAMAAVVVNFDTPANRTNSSVDAYRFNFTATSSDDAFLTCAFYAGPNPGVSGALGGENVTIANNTMGMIEAGGLPIGFGEGDWYWYITCNDTTTFKNTTGQRTFRVDTKPPIMNESNTAPSSPTTYNSSQTHLFNTTVKDVLNAVDTVIFTFNNTQYIPVNASDVFTKTFTALPAGTYYYNWTSNDSVGNSNTTPTLTYTVNKASSVLNLYLNGTQNNITVATGSTINITAILSEGTGIIQLYKDGTLINSGASPLTNFTKFDSVGVFNITARYTTTENYTGSVTTYITTAQDVVSPSITLLAPSTGANSSTTAYNFTWLTRDDTSANTSCALRLDTTTYSSQQTLNNTPQNRSVASIADGIHSWNVTCTDGYNTATSATNTFKVDTVGPVFSNKSAHSEGVLPGTSGQYIFNVSILDALNGVTASPPPRMWYGYNGVADTQVTLDKGDGNDYYTRLNLPEGSTLTYDYTATDTVNNTATSSPDETLVIAGNNAQCQSTKAIIFTAFGLIALFAIVGAAYLLISSPNVGDIGAMAVSIIGLGILVMVGIVVIAQVATSVCI